MTPRGCEPLRLSRTVWSEAQGVCPRDTTGYSRENYEDDVSGRATPRGTLDEVARILEARAASAL